MFDHLWVVQSFKHFSCLQDVVSLLHKLKHCGTEKEVHLRALGKALRDPSAQLNFIKYGNTFCQHLQCVEMTYTSVSHKAFLSESFSSRQENSINLLVGLLSGSNAQCRLQAVRCLHELSHSPNTNVASACLPATPYLLTYLSGQTTKFTVSAYSYLAPCV